MYSGKTLDPVPLGNLSCKVTSERDENDLSRF